MESTVGSIASSVSSLIVYGSSYSDSCRTCYHFKKDT